jgi:hypothetical protein
MSTRPQEQGVGETLSKRIWAEHKQIAQTDLEISQRQLLAEAADALDQAEAALQRIERDYRGTGAANIARAALPKLLAQPQVGHHP